MVDRLVVRYACQPGRRRRAVMPVMVVLFGLAVALAAAGGPAATPAVPPLPTAPAVTDLPSHRVLDGVAVPMRDGSRLMATLWLPKGRQEPFPTLLIMTPYDRHYFGAALPDPDSRQPELPPIDDSAVLIVDWRGFFGSKDAAKPNPPPNQLGLDGYDAVEWAAGQGWSEGKVGMWGPSALGQVQFATAVERPPHLACIVPVVVGIRYSYERYYYGGVLKEGSVHLLETAGYGPQTIIRQNPRKSALWLTSERTLSPKVGRIEVPVLLIGGWYDHNGTLPFETFEELRRDAGPLTRAHSRLLFGPWRHVAVGALHQGELEFPKAEGAAAAEAGRFLDRWLRGRDTGIDERPAVRYFVMGADEWRDAASFPPPGITERRMYLRAGGALSEEPPAADEAGASFRFDPADPSPTVGGLNAFRRSDPLSESVGDGPRDQRARVESRPDCLIYTTPSLDEAVTLEGTARVELFVSSDRRDTDAAVRLTDVWPDGRSMLVSDGIWRMRYRDSLTEEEWMEPGQVYRVTVPVTPTAISFGRGHRIRVTVSSSNFPRFAVNPNTGPDEGSPPLVATNRIHHDAEHPSVLVLPGQ